MHKLIFFWSLLIKRIKSEFALPAGVLSQSVSEVVDLIICRSRFFLEGLVLITDHCQFLKFRDQILILSLKLLPFHVRFLEALDFSSKR